MDKLYVVVRADLSQGDILAQSNHATSQFSRMHRELHDAWVDRSNNIVILAIPTERDLGALVRKSAELGIHRVEIYEPNLGNELTACAFTDAIARHVSQLPLALKAPRAAA
jgi:peptidyl-tRNA hydrolase